MAANIYIVNVRGLRESVQKLELRKKADHELKKKRVKFGAIMRNRGRIFQL